MTAFTEAVAEGSTLERFGKLGDRVIHGSNVAPGEPAVERGSSEQVGPQGWLQEVAANTVLQQAELLSDFWTEGVRA